MLTLTHNPTSPARKVASAPRRSAPAMTVGQRWRLRRNLLILLAHKGGASQRMIADVFGMARSRVGEIVNGFESREARAA